MYEWLCLHIPDTNGPDLQYRSSFWIPFQNETVQRFSISKHAQERIENAECIDINP